MTEAFITATQMEYYFWQAAYDLKSGYKNKALSFLRACFIELIFMIRNKHCIKKIKFK